MKLLHGDCFDRMAEIPDDSVDAIITDPPYGTIKNIGAGLTNREYKDTSWDDRLDIDRMLAECDRVLRTNGMLLLFAQGPFTSQLVTREQRNTVFCYKMVWVKTVFANPFTGISCPGNLYEEIVVYRKNHSKASYKEMRAYAKRVVEWCGVSHNKLMDIIGHEGFSHFWGHSALQFGIPTADNYEWLTKRYGLREMPGYMEHSDMREKMTKTKRIFNATAKTGNVFYGDKESERYHPTQKPVKIISELIELYTNPGDTVLDFTMGSGTTGVACWNTEREFIGIERDSGYYAIAVERIAAEQRQRKLFTA